MVVGIPSMTYVSVAEAVLRSGLKLIFQDRVEVGHGYELELHNPRPHSAVRVVDSAHEFGRDTWKKWGSGFVALSFYPTKCLAGAEGGAVLTDNPAFIEYATSWRIGGRTKMGRGYEVKRRGWQANMTDVQAAILVPQLPSHLDMLNTKRADMRDAYNAALGEKNTSLHLYTIDVADRDAFVDYMSEHEVETSIHFPPLHLQVPYRNIKTAQTMSTTNERWATTVSLPLHTRLTEDDVRKVAELVKLWCHSHPISSRALVTSARWT
jgi:dTDP-4-amino-4,6-dideoxygalactose transaminase